jgi:chorismate mutase/prephenate dehydratase
MPDARAQRPVASAAPAASDPVEALAVVRREIDAIDRQLIDLLNRRAAASLKVAEVKRNGDMVTYVPSREQEVVDNVLAANRGPLTADHVRAIYAEILSASRQLQRPLRIAYFGPAGTFTHHAAEAAVKANFGSFVEYLPQRTVEEVFASVERENAEYGVVPIENSTEGSVGRTLDRFIDSPLQICAEIRLRISHHLVGQGPLAKVQRVYSHPQALAQCRRWLMANLPAATLVESSSTSAAVRQAAGEPGVAAIGSEAAAIQYGVPVLAGNIQDQADNTTRFLLLGHEPAPPSGQDRTALLISVRDRAGALYDVLGVFARRKINLSRIESRPSRRQPWEYVFFIDLAGHPETPNTAAALDELRPSCTLVKVLGAWPVAPVHGDAGQGEPGT